MWTPHGWQSVSADEVGTKHPGGTVSAQSGLFMCDLCGQYVTFANGSIYRPYFKHSSSEADKSCPERTFGASYVPSYKPKEHDLPFRLSLNNSSFEIEIGILSLPEELLQKLANEYFSIIDAKGNILKYSFSRIHHDSVTYIKIIGEPSPYYVINIPKDNTNSNKIIWPTRIYGIDQHGTLFNQHTGKKVPVDGDVTINTKYYLLTTYSIYSIHYFYGSNSIHMRQLLQCKKDHTVWYVHEIEATAMDMNAARFFLNLHCRLSENPLFLQPLWPLHIETPYLIKHNSEHMVFYAPRNDDKQSRSFTIKKFPDTVIRSPQCTDKGTVINIVCNERQQLITAGSSHVLVYTYLRRDDLSTIRQEIDIDVRDGNDNIIKPGVYDCLPDDNVIKVTAPFDGRIVVMFQSSILSRRNLCAGQLQIIDNIKYGMEIKLFQGLDNIWSVAFSRPAGNDNINDDILYRKLVSFSGSVITLPHSFGATVHYFDHYPKTRAWIITAVRKGTASAEAVRYLKRFILLINHHERGEG